MMNTYSVRRVVLARPGIALILFLGMYSTVQASGLGVADEFSLFVLGDASSVADSEGRVAVGGDAVFSNYGIAFELGGFTGDSLVVGGNLDYQGGTVFNGDVKVGGTASPFTATLATGSLTDGVDPLPINFIEEKQYLQLASTHWSNEVANGTTVFAFDGLTLTGTDASLNVFDVLGSNLSSANSFIINAPLNSTVLVNIDAAANTMSNMGVTLNGVENATVLYNFYESTSLSIINFSPQGTVLAPYALVTAQNGHTQGTMIANAYTVTQGYESHLDLFTGTLPVVPEPGSLTLFILSATVLLKRKRALRMERD